MHESCMTTSEILETHPGPDVSQLFSYPGAMHESVERNRVGPPEVRERVEQTRA